MGNVPPLMEKSSPQKKILEHHYPELRQYLQFEAIYPYLVQNKLLTQDQVHELLYSTPNPLEKVDKVLLFIPRSRPDFLEIFVACLKLSANGTHHEHLANGLERSMADAKLSTETVASLGGESGDKVIERGYTASPRQQYKATVGNQDDDDEDSGESSNGESADHPLIIHPTEPHGPGQSWWRKNWHYKLISAVCVAVVCGVLLLGAFLGASVGPGVHDYNIGIHRNDTIVVPIRPSSRLVHMLDLRTDPTDEASCDSLALLLPCAGLQRRYTPDVPLNFFTDPTKFFYMLNGSSVKFFFRHEQQDMQIWVFNDYDIYSDYIEAGTLDQLECSKASAPKGTQCLPLSPSSPTSNITIKNTSYYFFTCSPRPSCLETLDWTIDLYWYDYVDYMQTAVLHNVSSGHPTEIVIQKKRFDVLHFGREVDMCLLLYIRYNRIGHTQTCSLHSTLYIRGITINQGVWVFASFSILAVAALVIVYVCCCYWQRRKQNATGQEHLRMERTI